MDIFVSVRKYIIEESYLEAIIALCYAIFYYNGIYKDIISSDNKIKASDLQVRLLETLVKLLKDDNLYNSILNSYVTATKELLNKLSFAKDEINNTHYTSEDITDDYSSLKTGQCLIILNDSEFRNVLQNDDYKKYDILGVDSVTNDRFFFRSVNNLVLGSGYQNISWFNRVVPDAPNLLKEIDAFKRLYDEAFLHSSMMIIEKEMINIANAAFVKCNTSKEELDVSINGYLKLLNSKISCDIINVLRNDSKEVNNTNIKSSKTFTVILIIIIAIVIILYLSNVK